jgi:hypothetical protein
LDVHGNFEYFVEKIEEIISSTGYYASLRFSSE